MLRHTIVALAASTLALRAATSQVATPAMVGHWKGEAQIFSSWTTARSLTVDIRINANDEVSGKIGDAQLVKGRLLSNRGWFRRTIHVNTDYRIIGSLEGRIIAAEGVIRSSVSLPLNWMNGRFEGSVATSGTEIGGPESAILTAGGLVLRRAPDMVVCEERSIPGLTQAGMSGIPAQKTQ